MAEDFWFDRLGETLTRSRLASYAAPISSGPSDASDVQVRPFGPYDAGSGNWQFSNGFHFELPAGSNARYLFAMTTGSMQYKPAPVAEDPSTVILTRGDAVASAQARTVGSLPAWYPQPRIIVYENVDPADARQAAGAALAREGELVRALKRVQKGRSDPKFTADASQLVELWLQDKIPEGLTVLGGDLVGGCGKSAIDGKLEASVRIVDHLDPPPTLFYNPAYYIALWDAMGWLVGGNALLPKQADTSGLPVATGRLVFVKRTGGSNTPPFASPAAASSTIGAAIGAASDGDAVLILDQETYPESVVIDKPISVTSIGTSAATSPSPDYPTLDGQSAQRPITIRSVNTGVAHVSKLLIINGRASSASTPRGDGGGILVERVHNTVISSCVIRNCQAPGTGVGVVQSPLGEGFGGGISVYHASPSIVGCLIDHNHATGLGMGIGVYGYGWPAIFDCVVSNNVPPDSISPFLRGECGGIGIQISAPKAEKLSDLLGAERSNLSTYWNSDDLERAKNNHVRIIRCKILNNESRDDGGGVYISVNSRVIMRSTEVRGNKAKGAGGGVRATMNSKLHLIESQITDNEANLGNIRSGGDGISTRNTLLKIERTTIEDNMVHEFAGGGLYFNSTDEGSLYLFASTVKDFDWNDILIDVFGYRQAYLMIDEASAFSNNIAAASPSSSTGKGGALYVLRYKGQRNSGLGPVQGPWGPGGVVTEGAAPISVTITNVDALKASNASSLSNANRLFLDDEVASPPANKDDSDLPTEGTFHYP